jgi:hypothetical protein
VKPHIVVVYKLYVNLGWPTLRRLGEYTYIPQSSMHDHLLDESLSQDILDDCVVALCTAISTPVTSAKSREQHSLPGGSFLGFWTDDCCERACIFHNQASVYNMIEDQLALRVTSHEVA